MGAPMALVGLLRDGDCSAKLVAANALGIVEDVFCTSTSIRDSAVVVLENLAGILRGEDDLVINAAIDVLLALAKYERIMFLLKSSGVITVLVDLLRNGNHGIIEKATKAVAQLSYVEYIRD
ncbi:hypothetical protein BAE44_0017855 [Dichanthelium oligosanthes]|uniref:U-box domain-containing protein 4 n=1 Tax=Dichanthelium oligosanthes TaxID=888268 RepID=A0A1E5V7H5_9POAL|nr:hypothetical protein BAE44_0017855 [Dichanthelium oligosanthes]